MAGERRRAVTSNPTPIRPGQVGWVGLLLLTTAGSIADRLHTLPDYLSGGIAVVFATLIAWGLWNRLGLPSGIAAALTLAYGALAVGLSSDLLLRGAAVMTAVLTSVFAIVMTVPASRLRLSFIEMIGAAIVGLAGAFSVVAYHVDVNASVFRYTVFFLALLAAFAAVYQPGAGLHGLGRRGYALLGGISVLLIFAVGYSLALTHWGSHYVGDTVDDIRSWMHDYLGAAPHLLEVFIGVPSLCWGVFTRARRRQGWWICAFGVALTGPASVCLVGGAETKIAMLGGIYSIALGMVVGWMVVRIEQLFTGSRGRRARRSEEATAHRPEPSRWAALR